MRGLLLPLLFCPTYFCLQFIYLGVPESVSSGDPVWLHCDYDLEGDELYSVRWYKDNKEFYRFLPSDMPSGQKMFNLSGVFLDLSFSNETHAFLYTTDEKTVGWYGCEVKTELPSFNIIRVNKLLRVHVIPKEPPQIYGFTNNYKKWDLVNLDCVYGPSNPWAQIIWYINEKEAPYWYVIPLDNYRSRRYPSWRAKPTESQLRFVLGPEEHSVTCFAFVPKVHTSSNIELLYGAEGVEWNRYTQPGEKGPQITGVKERYNLGDLVDVNCSTAKPTHRFKLEWRVNGELVPPNFLSGDRGSNLELNFHVTRAHLRREKMSLKCTEHHSVIVFKTSVHFSLAPSRSPSLH